MDPARVTLRVTIRSSRGGGAAAPVCDGWARGPCVSVVMMASYSMGQGPSRAWRRAHAVQPTSGLLLLHKHPDDKDRAFGVFETVIRDAKPFSCYHRIIDAKGEVRFVLSVGRGHVNANARVEQVSGFFVDMTQVVSPSDRVAADSHLEDLARSSGRMPG